MQLKRIKLIFSATLIVLLMGCNKTIETLQITVYETSESGNKITKNNIEKILSRQAAASHIEIGQCRV